jgi:hypothetical protein
MKGPTAELNGKKTDYGRQSKNTLYASKKYLPRGVLQIEGQL